VSEDLHLHSVFVGSSVGADRAARFCETNGSGVNESYDRSGQA
jgi:hypothetical protein